jgi:hypothetical protein
MASGASHDEVVVMVQPDVVGKSWMCSGRDRAAD